MQVNFFPEITELCPTFVQAAPALTAEKPDSIVMDENPTDIQKTIAIAFLGFIFILRRLNLKADVLSLQELMDAIKATFTAQT